MCFLAIARSPTAKLSISAWIIQLFSTSHRIQTLALGAVVFLLGGNFSDNSFERVNSISVPSIARTL